MRRGGDYAFKHRCDQLGQRQYRIMWFGQGSMHWEQLLPALQLQMITRGHPKMLIIHLGGNDIDTIPQFSLMKSIKEDLTYVHSVFHQTQIVWCDILPRLEWRNNKSDDTKTLNLKAQRINRAAHQYIADLSRGRVIKPHILWYMNELFVSDGVHLSDFGNLTYIQTFRNFLQSFDTGN